MTTDQIQQVIDTLLRIGEFLASKAFELALRQVYVRALGEFILFLVLIFISQVVGRKFIKLGNEKIDEDFIAWGNVIMYVVGIISAFSASRVLAYLINPEWYAVKLLLENFIK